MRWLLTVTLLSGCGSTVSFGTETRNEWCLALVANAPTGSSRDTPETLEELADINDVIATLCGE